MGISSEKAEAFIKSQQRLAQYFNKEAIEENQKALEKLEKEIYFQTQRANARKVSGVSMGVRWETDKSDEDIAKDVAKLQELQKQAEGLRNLIADLKGESLTPTPTENPNPNPNPNPEPDPNAKNPFEKFKDDLETAKKAWSEYEDLRKAGLAEEVKTQYDSYLKMGRTWMEYLQTMKEEYKGHVAELKEINVELAGAGFINKLPFEQFKKDWDEVNKTILKNSDQTNKEVIDHIESAIENDIDAQLKIEPEFDNKKLAADLKKFVATAEMKKLGNEFSDFGGIISQSSDLVGQFDEQLGVTYK